MPAKWRPRLCWSYTPNRSISPKCRTTVRSPAAISSDSTLCLRRLCAAFRTCFVHSPTIWSATLTRSPPPERSGHPVTRPVKKEICSSTPRWMPSPISSKPSLPEISISRERRRLHRRKPMSPELTSHTSKDHSPKDFERWGALPLHSRRAMVATADTDATDAAVAVLREGGSVVDAAITAAFALCVTQPGMCGLGGGGHLLARLANGQTLCLDFREQAPHSASRDMFADMPADASEAGWLAAATPGLVKGLAEAHRREGRLSWSRLLQPAIALAAEGHAVSYLRAQMLAGSAALRRNTESTRILLRDGHCFQPGEILRQPELAATLERIAIYGEDEFYHGKTADLLTRASIANGGALRLSDLDSFTCDEHQPLMYTYRGSE